MAVKTENRFSINICLEYVVAGHKMVDMCYHLCPLGGAVRKKVVIAGSCVNYSFAGLNILKKVSIVQC